MKKVYTFLRSKALLMSLSFALFSVTAFSQICGPVVEPFNTSGNGFTGDFSYNAAQQRLMRNNVIGTAVYTITTPTYKLQPGVTTLGFGFTLDGTEQVSRAEVVVMYISTLTNQMTTIFLTQFIPNYGGGTTATVCQAVDVTSLPGFPNGGQYRFRIELSSSTGSGVAAQTITFDNFRTNGDLSNSPLPVTFIGFDARKMSAGVQLTWKVAGEENINRYEVESSTDGRNFTTLTSLTRNGKDTYTYLDADTRATTIYYRIKNVDNDGKFKYSTVARMTNGKANIVIKAFPQPVQNQLTVQHPVIKVGSLLTVSTADGRVVRSVKPTTGSMQTYVDMNGLQAGLYMVRLDDGDGAVETMKVVKQ